MFRSFFKVAIRNIIRQRAYALINVLGLTIGISLEEWEAAGNFYRLQSQLLSDIYFNTDIEHDMRPSSDEKYVYIFSLIAFFIIIIACINFLNLSTARSAGRAREVGLRKVVGSTKRQLVRQFLTE